MHLIISQIKIIGTCIALYMELQSESQQKLQQCSVATSLVEPGPVEKKERKNRRVQNLHELSLQDPSGAQVVSTHPADGTRTTPQEGKRPFFRKSGKLQNSITYHLLNSRRRNLIKIRSLIPSRYNFNQIVAAVRWLEYCRYGVKPKKKSINPHILLPQCQPAQLKSYIRPDQKVVTNILHKKVHAYRWICTFRSLAPQLSYM